MTVFVDARVPVWLDGERRAGATYLIEGQAQAPFGAPAARFDARGPHVAACACCAGRSPAAVALARVFLEQARGHGPAIGCVIVRAGPAGTAEARQAVETDVLCQARYRLG